jgi:hypothetical protein
MSKEKKEEPQEYPDIDKLREENPEAYKKLVKDMAYALIGYCRKQRKGGEPEK